MTRRLGKIDSRALGWADNPSLDLTFTATGADTITLQRITPTGGTCLVTWGDGTITLIAEDNVAATTHDYAGAGAYTVSLHNPERLTYIAAYSDAKIGGDISGWTLPASLERLYVHATSVEGDISGWTLTASLVVFSAHTTSVSGDISGWALPTSLTELYMYSTSVEGDISGWTLPASLEYFYARSTSVSGDISGWTLPANLEYFNMRSTSVEGDISGWTLPASLEYFYAYSTSVSGAPDCSGAVKLMVYRSDDCGLLQADVDATLWSLYQAAVAPRTGTNGTINVGGSNAAPTGTFQAASACPVDADTDGKEVAHELLNDTCDAFANHWATVTITT